MQRGGREISLPPPCSSHDSKMASWHQSLEASATEVPLVCWRWPEVRFLRAGYLLMFRMYASMSAFALCSWSRDDRQAWSAESDPSMQVQFRITRVS
jgi:hypothetical protein